MGLSASLTNALSGMRVSQNSLEVLSRNVANSGTPGYHRQSLSVIDTVAGNSSLCALGHGRARLQQEPAGLLHERHFGHGVRGRRAPRRSIACRRYLGKPGDAGSLDTMFGNLQNALQALSTSPDNYATRATVVSQAQAMATTLNSLTRDVQRLAPGGRDADVGARSISSTSR